VVRPPEAVALDRRAVALDRRAVALDRLRAVAVDRLEAAAVGRHIDKAGVLISEMPARCTKTAPASSRSDSL